MKNLMFTLNGLALAVVHAFFGFVTAFSAGISGGTSGFIYKLIFGILLFPLSVIPDGPDWLFWILWPAISLSWGFGLAYLIRKFLNRET